MAQGLEEGLGGEPAGPAPAACKENDDLLRRVNPMLAAEPMWAHASPLEQGGLVVATNLAGEYEKGRYWQIVVLILRKDEEGAIGVILNRPSSLNIGDSPVQTIGQVVTEDGEERNLTSDLQARFAAEPVYCGGFRAQQMVHIVHGQPLPSATEVVPGVYAGGIGDALAAIEDGVDPSTFKFFMGCMAWGPGELEEQVEHGFWTTASCARAVALKHCLQLPVPLWKEVCDLMGGEAALEAAKVYGESDYID